MFTRIVVGTDGSDTAAEAVRQAIDLAKLSGATLSIVSAYAPVSKRRVGSEQRDAPADIQYEIGPREDINLVLDAAAAEAKKEGDRGPDPPGRGRPRRGDPQRRRADQGRPDRRRQQGDDRGAPLPARQRPQQGLPSRSLQRDHRPHHLSPPPSAPRLARWEKQASWHSGSVARAASISPAPSQQRREADAARGFLQPASRPAPGSSRASWCGR